jgi:ribosomal-protein-alanine N-acetyltransferase
MAGFVFDHNRRSDGGVHCLHAAQGPTVASHAQELATLSPAQAAFWSIMRGGHRVGWLGCAFDIASRRAWLRGPLVADDSLLEVTVHVVGPTLESALPQIDEFDAFPAADDAPLNAWCAAAGYAPMQVHTVMRAEIQRLPMHPTTVRPATKRDLPAISDLHRTLFPTAYIRDADLERAAEGKADCALLVACGQDAEPVGYLYVQDNPSEQEAYVDYLGVAESHRGHGRGQALLDAAARWGARHGRPHLALTVREDRSSALNLYRHAGFAEVSAGRHWRKVVARA